MDASNQLPVGELVVDGSGRLLWPLEGYSGGVSGTFLASWDPGGPSGSVLRLGTSSARNALARSGEQLFLLGSSGLWEVQLAPIFTMSTAQRSSLETFATTQHGVGADSAGQPRLVSNHSGHLESVWAGSDGFWNRLDLGAADTGLIGVSVDGADGTRACFVRASKLLVY
jgi:hypothetical protein